MRGVCVARFVCRLGAYVGMAAVATHAIDSLCILFFFSVVVFVVIVYFYTSHREGHSLRSPLLFMLIIINHVPTDKKTKRKNEIKKNKIEMSSQEMTSERA